MSTDSLRRRAVLPVSCALVLCVSLGASGCGSGALPSPSTSREEATSPQTPTPEDTPTPTPAQSRTPVPRSPTPTTKPKLTPIPASDAQEVAQAVLVSFVLASDYANAHQVIESCGPVHDGLTYACYTPLIFGDDLDAGTYTCNWVVEVGRLTDGTYIRRINDLDECRSAASAAGGSVGSGDWERWSVAES